MRTCDTVKTYILRGQGRFTYHHRGKIDMDSMYNATDKLVMVFEVFKSSAI